MKKKADYYKLVTTQVSPAELDPASVNSEKHEEEEEVYYNNKKMSAGPAEAAVGFVIFFY